MLVFVFMVKTALRDLPDHKGTVRHGAVKTVFGSLFFKDVKCSETLPIILFVFRIVIGVSEGTQELQSD